MNEKVPTANKLPPIASPEANGSNNIEHIMGVNLDFIMGNFNAHHPIWNSAQPADTRGNELADQISYSDDGVINENAPTKVVGDTATSPGIIIAHPSIINTTKCSTYETRACSAISRP